MSVNHLGLPVADQERSLRFYTAYFGFDPAKARRFTDGTGRALQERMTGDGLTIFDVCEESDLVSFKCTVPGFHLRSARG